VVKLKIELFFLISFSTKTMSFADERGVPIIIISQPFDHYTAIYNLEAWCEYYGKDFDAVKLRLIDELGTEEYEGDTPKGSVIILGKFVQPYIMQLLNRILRELADVQRRYSR